MQFDYIVVGAGAAGAIVAARLSENPENRVLLLEEGPPDRHPAIHVPGAIAYALRNPRLARHEISEPVPGLNQRRVVIGRGKVLGGSTSVNGMMYVRGHADDYNEWAAQGNDGWSWDEVRPFFEKSVNRRDGDGGGPLPIRDIVPTRTSSLRYLEAAVNAGLEQNPAMNDGDQRGISRVSGTLRNGRRWSTAQAFLRPARRRGNLVIQPDAKVQRILFDGRRAVAVEYACAGADGRAQTRAATCAREIIVCGGAFGSAQLLLLSGIGNPDDLRAAGVKPWLPLPGVGANFHDHLMVHFYGRFRDGHSSLNGILRNPLAMAAQGLRWLLTRGGALSVTSTEIVGFASLGADSRPDVQLSFRPFVFASDAKGRPAIPAEPGFTLSATALRPRSRGWLRLRSADPRDPLVLQPNYLSDAADLDALVGGVALIRKILAQPPLQALLADPPLPDLPGDAALAEYIRAHAGTVFHPVGTCRMGRDENSVVDARLRVHGVRGLRVADASIMPVIPTANTMAATLMIGEKAAHMILEDNA